MADAVPAQTTDISEKYENPLDAPETSYINSFTVLKERIRHHYEICSDYYLSLWGEHIHHGYFTSPNQTKESAQIALMDLLITQSQLPENSSVLDVGCGLGGTSRYLAKTLNCHVTGITISPAQVKLARQLSRKESGQPEPDASEDNSTTSLTDFQKIDNGAVRFLELDAEKMGEYFTTTTTDTTVNKTTNPEIKPHFTTIWISEALSHLPNKPLFFQNAHTLLPPGGKLIIADWFKSPLLTPSQHLSSIAPIEDGMLLPPLCTQDDYVRFASEAGLDCVAGPVDISAEVAQTWDISWGLVQKPGLWAFAVSQGRDGLAFLQAFRAMRRGYKEGTFRYGVLVFRKPGEV